VLGPPTRLRAYVHRKTHHVKARRETQMASNSNRGVVYLKPGKVEVQKIDFPSFRNPAVKTIDHSVILKVVTTNICGSDQHMVRGRTTVPVGMVLGHEITDLVV
jgi:glutathione-independent formaldehyde dehydrogenase